MLVDEDNSGLLTAAVGLIVLVFAGVGLSLLVDRRFSFSSQVSTMNKLIEAERRELEDLQGVHRGASLKLAEVEPMRQIAGSKSSEAGKSLANLTKRREVLEAECGRLRTSISAMEEEFVSYRTKYREKIWAEAIGHSLGTLVVRGGREYRQAVISRVSEVGLEIRHENGTARLQATDLDASLQERFQWDDESRRARLREEHAAHASAERVSGVPSPVPIRQPDLQSKRVHERGNLQEVEALRARVIGWKSKIAQVRQQRDHALAEAYGTRSSSTGGLETWEQKAVRLGKELARLEGALAVAKADLARIAPNDPLLSQNPGTR
jgi:hypothetical protein